MQRTSRALRNIDGSPQMSCRDNHRSIGDVAAGVLRAVQAEHLVSIWPSTGSGQGELFLPATTWTPAGTERQKARKRQATHSAARAEQLSGDHYWFPVLRGLIESGAPAQLGPIAIAAYLVIKASSDFKTGTADASAREVAAAVGCSERAARTAIKRLVDFGLLSSSTVNGRRPTFQLREMLPLRAANGDERAWVSFPFSADEFSVRVKKAAEAAVAEALGRVAGPAVNAPISITAGSFSISVHLHFPGAPNGG